jgi:hypothetical protein
VVGRFSSGSYQTPQYPATAQGYGYGHGFEGSSPGYGTGYEGAAVGAGLMETGGQSTPTSWSPHLSLPGVRMTAVRGVAGGMHATLLAQTMEQQVHTLHHTPGFIPRVHRST